MPSSKRKKSDPDPIEDDEEPHERMARLKQPMLNFGTKPVDDEREPTSGYEDNDEDDEDDEDDDEDDEYDDDEYDDDDKDEDDEDEDEAPKKTKAERLARKAEQLAARSSVALFDPQDRRWYTLPPLPEPRVGHAMVVPLECSFWL